MLIAGEGNSPRTQSESFRRQQLHQSGEKLASARRRFPLAGRISDTFHRLVTRFYHLIQRQGEELFQIGCRRRRPLNEEKAFSVFRLQVNILGRIDFLSLRVFNGGKDFHVELNDSSMRRETLVDEERTCGGAERRISMVFEAMRIVLLREVDERKRSDSFWRNFDEELFPLGGGGKITD